MDLYALKILAADGSGYESDLILALQWAVDHDIDVVNMSLGTHDVVPALQAAVESAAAAGLLMVAASGNTVTLQEMWYGCAVTYPGAYPQVLATTFTNPNDALTGYSCTGPGRFASPGDNIFSPVPVGNCPCAPRTATPRRAGRRWRRRTSPVRSRCSSAPGSPTPGRRGSSTTSATGSARPPTSATACRRCSGTPRSRPPTRATRSTSGAA